MIAEKAFASLTVDGICHGGPHRSRPIGRCMATPTLIDLRPMLRHNVTGLI